MTGTRAATRLRTAVVSDVPDIARLSRNARRVGMPWLPVLHSLRGDLAFFGNRVLPEQTVEVVEDDRSILGFVAYRDDWVHHLYVAPKAWRTGIGSQLLRRAMDARAFLQLWVFEQNTRAQAFYFRHGFVIAEQTDGSNNEEKCPDLRMTWAKVAHQSSPVD